ncbi:MAG: hypothetical protein IJW54_03860 [Clostridia bacterium]|nr:hypothetical protein [Clostridia bacterium]
MKVLLEFLNEDEWLQHASKLMKERGTKSDEEILKEIVKFDYKFSLIPDESQVSLTEPQSS